MMLAISTPPGDQQPPPVQFPAYTVCTPPASLTYAPPGSLAPGEGRTFRRSLSDSLTPRISPSQQQNKQRTIVSNNPKLSRSGTGFCICALHGLPCSLTVTISERRLRTTPKTFPRSATALLQDRPHLCSFLSVNDRSAHENTPFQSRSKRTTIFPQIVLSTKH